MKINLNNPLKIALLQVLLTSGSWAMGSGVYPFKCYFNVPTVDSMQTPGPYIGKGKTETEASFAALKVCKKDLDFWKPGVCDQYFQSQRFMTCEGRHLSSQ
jgi:hypothetical protein